MGFEQVIGQKEAQKRLMQLLREERLPHALMLCGPQGCGKKALAIGFAKVLLSQGNASANTTAMLDNLENQEGETA